MSILQNKSTIGNPHGKNITLDKKPSKEISNQPGKEKAQLAPAELGCCVIQEIDSALTLNSKMFIFIKQAETD